MTEGPRFCVSCGSTLPVHRPVCPGPALLAKAQRIREKQGRDPFSFPSCVTFCNVSVSVY